MRLRESRWLEVESQLPTMAFERARMESAKELDLEKELSKVNQEPKFEALLANIAKGTTDPRVEFILPK